METKSKEFNPSLSSGDNGRKILIKNDGENRGGKGGVGEIIHRPAKDLSFLNGHVEAGDGVTRKSGDGVNFLAPYPPRFSVSQSIF